MHLVSKAAAIATAAVGVSSLQCSACLGSLPSHLRHAQCADASRRGQKFAGTRGRKRSGAQKAEWLVLLQYASTQGDTRSILEDGAPGCSCRGYGGTPCCHATNPHHLLDRRRCTVRLHLRRARLRSLTKSSTAPRPIFRREAQLQYLVSNVLRGPR